jgi:hypothetical protein
MPLEQHEYVTRLEEILGLYGVSFVLLHLLPCASQLERERERERKRCILLAGGRSGYFRRGRRITANCTEFLSVDPTRRRRGSWFAWCCHSSLADNWQKWIFQE